MAELLAQDKHATHTLESGRLTAPIPYIAASRCRRQAVVVVLQAKQLHRLEPQAHAQGLGGPPAQVDHPLRVSAQC